MNFKKPLKTLLIVLCISLSLPAFSNSTVPVTELNRGLGENSDKKIDPLVRLHEIKDMNKENLSRSEKKDLRKEVKEIRKALRDRKNGVYLSVGAIIIIALLLIILL